MRVLASSTRKRSCLFAKQIDTPVHEERDLIKRPCMLIGAGGHAKVLIDCLTRQHMTVLGCLDVDPALAGRKVADIAVLGDDDAMLANYAPEAVLLVNAIGSTRSMERRRAVYETLKARGYSFATVVHPSAVLGSGVTVAEGAQLMAGVVVQTDARIGANSIVNTGTVVDHDSIVGAHVHLAPGCAISGEVIVGDGTHIGTGASVIQGVRIGKGCLVAAGAVVVHNVPDGACVVGVPAVERSL